MAHVSQPALSEGLKRVQESIMASANTATGGSNSTSNPKIAQLEEHSRTPDQDSRLTTDYGVKQNNTDDWLRIVSDDHTGPGLLEDNASREKIHRFDHERIPERVVHARGAGAHGVFRLKEAIPELTHAGFLTDTSRETPIFVRFSTVLGSRGSADTTPSNSPMSSMQASPSLTMRSLKLSPPITTIGILLHCRFMSSREFFSSRLTGASHTEATHMSQWTMSDRSIPRSYRMMQGFGVNTYTLINDKGERHFVKFHWTPELGVHSLVWDEALKLAGQDPDFHRKDLMEAIENGAYPRWKFGIQVLPESREHEFDFDILDATKLWPEDDVPIRYIGELELNRNVDEYFPETEQVAFATGHAVPGIGFSDDPLLQGRNFSYFDTQLSRLGVNWQELPINKAVCPVMSNNRDGAMRHTITKGKANYWPNRFEANPPAAKAEGAYIEYQQKVAGIKARTKSAKFKEHYNQAQLFYNSMSQVEKNHMVAAFSFELDHCDDPIVYERYTQRLADIDLGLAQAVAEQVGGPIPQKAGRPNHGKKASGLSQFDYIPSTPTIASRRVAIVIADGYDATAFNAAKAAVTAASALPFVIGTRRSEIYPAGAEKKPGNGVVPAHHLEGQRSTMFDALFLPGGEESFKTLRKSGRAMHWIREAFGHLKAIAATGEAVELVNAAIALPEIKVSQGGVEENYGVITLKDVKHDSLKEKVEIAKDGAGFLEQFFYAISQHRAWARELDGLNVQVAY
ncbi:catalase-1 [Verticillium alfalfae VaMs.102]|uniref:Catalase n=1 Tax=Verticillium alfalfae (strain VaMs.102 / ATCC MYA-4576 / FGSC 10136) TaxID=526221 RepID=C9SEP3_VERA1|nr:catalase-1 [Verticillium alfalfae VaMs.102]EEY16636.1 catalase-1 [Verticillium alfalfae VaMs.102]